MKDFPFIPFPKAIVIDNIFIEKTNSDIYLPDGTTVKDISDADPFSYVGETIIAVGDEVTRVKPGDVVRLFNNVVPIILQHKDKSGVKHNYMFFRESDILAILK